MSPLTLSDKGKVNNGFLSSVALLTASAAAVKLIGVFYKIPLVSMIGIEGMAYFLAAYHIYTLLFMISTAGLPVAVSILVSRRIAQSDEEGAEGVFSASLKLFFVIGAVCGGFMYIFADTVAASIKIPEAAISIRAIAPALLFVSLSSAVRGYFQGRGVMYPTAISQVIESAGKLVLGLLFCAFGQRLGYAPHELSAFAIAGISAGSLLCAVYLFSVKLRHRNGAKKARRERRILKELLRIAAPITLGAAVISLTGVIDTALVSSRLQAAGFSSAEANSMYSSYGNLAIPLFNLVPSFISPIAVTVAPMLASAAELGDRERERNLLLSAVRLTALITVPAAIGLALFSEPILLLLYPSQKNAVGLAAPMLSLLAPAIFSSCMITVTNAVLQSYKKERVPIYSMLFGVGVKTVVEYFLLASPKIGIFAAPVSTLLCDLTIVSLNLYFTERHSCGTSGLIFAAWRPLFASLIPSAASVSLYWVLISRGSDPRLSLLGVIVLDVLSYLIFAAWNGSVREEDLMFLPKGEKIIKIMKKIRLLRNDNEKRRQNKRAVRQGKI